MTSWRFDGAPNAYGSVTWEDDLGAYSSWVTFRRGDEGWLLYEGVSGQARSAHDLPERWQEIRLRRSTAEAILAELRASGFAVRRMTDAEVAEQQNDEW